MLERHDAPHILRGTQGQLRVSFYVDGALTDAAAGVTVSVTRLDGTALVTAQAATHDSTGGVYSYLLTPSQTASLDLLTAVWTGSFESVSQSVTTYHEIVGAHLFNVADARAWGDRAMASTVNYPNDQIAEGRDRIASEFEGILGFSLIPRIDEEIFDGAGYSYLSLPRIHLRNVRSIETRDSGGTTWTALDTDELADVYAYPSGRIVRETLGSFPTGQRNVRIRFEHGLDVPLPGARERALTVLRSQLVPSNLMDRAFLMSDETGTYRLSTPDGVHRWYGIPYVDSWLEQNRTYVPAVA